MPRHIEVTVRDVADLFVAPAPDPLNGRFWETSGIDRLVTQLQPLRWAPPPRVVVTIQAVALPDGFERPTAAVQGYCRARIQEIEREEAAL